MIRKNTKTVYARGVPIGGGNPVTVQSMLSAPAHDREANVRQARELAAAGCEILRVAVPDMEAVRLIPAIREAVKIPLVADIHFDWKLAVESVAAGADKIRINPGNIGVDEHVRAVAHACSEKRIPIRIGVNSGSLEKKILAKYGRPTPQAMVESALYHVGLLNRFDFDDIVISVKASDAASMVEACRLLSGRCDYPLHIGVTEAGTERSGVVKSAVGIGALLLEGIGDTIRVSLTGNPVREVEAAFEILRAAGLRHDGPELISCPTCGRTRIDLVSLANRVEEKLKDVKMPIRVAVMGCAVNGPGEAREADIGVAGGIGEGLLFRHGKILRKVPEDRLLDELMEEIHKLENGILPD